MPNFLLPALLAMLAGASVAQYGGKFVVRGPGSIDLGAFATKDIRVVERLKLQLRIESFNVMNHMNLQDINTQLGNRAFGQVSGAAMCAKEGTGLGLPLVRRLTELHGGQMRLESSPGDGTTVVLEFPAARAINYPRALAAAE